MIIPGLVSVTFRNKTPLEIVKLCNQANLSAIEWGGDVHVPPKGGNAAEIRRMTADHGLTVSSYGSYYRVTQPMDDLRTCLDTAAELGTDVMRIWCGVKGSKDAEEERKSIVDQLIQCAEEARARKITLALEYHGRTLTDDRSSVQRLMKETACVFDALKFYWQPRFDWSEKEILASLDDVRPLLSHLHVFTWLYDGKGFIRKPLSDAEALWKKVFSSIKEDHYALMEFVQDDSDEALLRDAAALNSWIQR
ncbi:MAG: sugar phosphate isomerase/epimerase [Clostridia bacterium]|nr:sugar phosphate isomerase/epimerase [Clostridia bacterium]